MNLMRNPYATHVDFRDLKGLIENNPRAVPCNIDMVFERKGYFLVGEWKNSTENISVGQRIMLQNLAKIPEFTVLIIIGSTNEETVINNIFKVKRDGHCVKVGNGLDDLKKLVSLWYDFANGIPTFF